MRKSVIPPFTKEKWTWNASGKASHAWAWGVWDLDARDFVSMVMHCCGILLLVVDLDDAGLGQVCAGGLKCLSLVLPAKNTVPICFHTNREYN